MPIMMIVLERKTLPFGFPPFLSAEYSVAARSKLVK